MTYIAARPRLLFSFTGKPPVLSGSREISELSPDDQQAWRHIHEISGGNRATKRRVEEILAPHVGPLDWGSDNLDQPLDLGKFFAEVAKLHTGQRWVALCWAHAHSQGTDVHADPKSVLMTRTAFDPTIPRKSAEQVMAEAKASSRQSELETMNKIFEAESRAQAAENVILQHAAEIAKSRQHIIPTVTAKTPKPISGRSVQDISVWKRVFDFIDVVGSGRVSKQRIQARLAPEVGPFYWDDDDDETPLTFQQFVECMTSASVPVERRHAILTWGRNKCPMKIFPMGGGQPYYTQDYIQSNTAFGPRTASYPGTTVVATPTEISAADLQCWWKLFNLIDQNKSGRISRLEINKKMASMVGAFEWEDDNNDGQMDFGEFVQCMNNLPLSKKYTCLRWAGSHCPDQTGGRPAPVVHIYQHNNLTGEGALPAQFAQKSLSAEDVEALKKMFNFIDTRRIGKISRRDINLKMAPMVGSFEWNDTDADGFMDFGEFVDCMDSLPAKTKFTCLLWAKTQCPQ